MGAAEAVAEDEVAATERDMVVFALVLCLLCRFIGCSLSYRTTVL